MDKAIKALQDNISKIASNTIQRNLTNTVGIVTSISPLVINAGVFDLHAENLIVDKDMTLVVNDNVALMPITIQNKYVVVARW